MITKEDLLDIGWSETDRIWPMCHAPVYLRDAGLNSNGARSDMNMWWELSVNPGHSFDKSWTVIQEHTSGGISGAHRIEQIYVGRIPNKGALLQLQQWLGIK